jgi:hypothetical protein
MRGATEIGHASDRNVNEKSQLRADRGSAVRFVEPVIYQKKRELAMKATVCLKLQVAESKPDGPPKRHNHAQKQEGPQKLKEYPVMLMKTKVDKKRREAQPTMRMIIGSL